MGVNGLGYYPVSRFMHVDVRDEKAYWVDSGGDRRRDRAVSHSE